MKNELKIMLNRRTFKITFTIMMLIVVVIPFLIGIFLNYITFRSTGWKAIDYYGFDNYSAMLTGEADYTEAITKKGLPFLRLYMESPLMYNIFYAMLAGILAGVCSMFNYALSLMVRRYKILILLPSYILLYVLRYLGAIISYSGIKIETNLLEYLTMDIICGKYWLYFVLVLAVMILSSSAVVYVVNKRKAEYE